ncbi:MAG: UvrB/UvrC motif-containing protein [Thermoguttaceae bacterium]
MKCQKCDKPAIYHITELTGGKPHELHLCEDHAKNYLSETTESSDPVATVAATLAQELGQSNEMGDAAIEDLKRLDRETCPMCGVTFFDFRSKGRFGCPHDYVTFARQLEPLMMNIHGGSEHVGKIPKRRGRQSLTDENHGDHRMLLIRLRREMNDAVTTENYELASKLRDQIKKIEEG